MGLAFETGTEKGSELVGISVGALSAVPVNNAPRSAK
jgi:hypothetical protein